MEALEQLKSVLCDPEGNVCISGSDGDRKVISDALESLDQQVAALRIDAERYQILRRGQHWSVINGVGDELRADQLDAAIDAAMGEM